VNAVMIAVQSKISAVMTRPPRHLKLGSVVAIAAQLWSETVEVQDSLPTPRLLLVCTRWCLHQSPTRHPIDVVRHYVGPQRCGDTPTLGRVATL
jgi:hypothetical protein